MTPDEWTPKQIAALTVVKRYGHKPGLIVDVAPARGWDSEAA